jgi:hypothetical protein
MSWEVLKSIIKIYIYARIKFNDGQNFSHAHILIWQSSSSIYLVRSTITIILSSTLVGRQNNYA